MKRNGSDLSETEVRERLCPALRVEFDQLAWLDFPEAAYIVEGQKLWTFAPVALWINAKVLADLTGTDDSRRLGDVVQLVLWMKGVPDMPIAEATHLAHSALVDMTMKRVFGYGMRDDLLVLPEDDGDAS